MNWLIVLFYLSRFQSNFHSLLISDETTEKFANGMPVDLSRQLQGLWEFEYCPVATKLLEIISNNNSIE